MHDLVIRAATVVDGAGGPGRRADVAIEDGRIAAVGRVAATSARRSLDADGLTLTPGFIDLHAHSDLTLFERPEHHLKVGMGVTSELLGQDGLSYAPGSSEAIVAMRDLAAGINGAPDLDYDWTSVDGYLRRLEAARPAVNVAYLVPHGLLRMSQLGMADRRASDDEIEAMAALAVAGMEDGALGLSSGLSYAPATWSDTRELTRICRAIAPYGGLYVTHHRDYGAGLVKSVSEALEIGRDGGVPVHFSHFQVSGEPWRGRAHELLGLLASARRAGQDVSLDAYPYTAASTLLGAFLPEFAQAGTPGEIVARLQQPDFRRAVVAELDVHPRQFFQTGWEAFVIAGTAEGGDGVAGRRIPEIAASRGTSVGELVCDLLVEQRMRVAVVVHAGDEHNVRSIMGDPTYMVGTDAVLVGEAIHPRAAGTYPRILGTYVREAGVLSLERAVRAMSGAPADRLGLVDRGYVRAGYRADLVLFDAGGVAGPASYAEPKLAPSGLPYVFVNGDAVKWDDEMTGARPGRIIRRTGTGSRIGSRIGSRTGTGSRIGSRIGSRNIRGSRNGGAA